MNYGVTPITFTGTVNGTNLVFTSNLAPDPSASPTIWDGTLYRVQGVHYNVSGSTFTFTAGNAPTVALTGFAGAGDIDFIKVDSVTAMRAITSPDVNVLYYLAELGKQGFFRYDSTDTTSTDNTGTILVAGSARFKRIYDRTAIVSWFGAAGDGTTDDAVAIQAALDSGAPELIFEQGKIYPVKAELSVASPIKIDFRNATIKAVFPSIPTPPALPVPLATVFRLKSSYISMLDGTVDMNFQARNGLRGDGTSAGGYSNLLLTNLNIKSQITTAGNLDGGLYLTSFSDVHVLDGKYTDINNTGDEGSVDHSPAIKFVDCSFIWVNNISIKNAGVGINAYSSEHVYAAGVKMEGINNNGYYIQQDSTDIDISGGYIRDFKDAGVVFKIDSKYSTDEYESSLRVRGVEFNNSDEFVDANPSAAMRGIGLRRGSGLLVSDSVFINCGTAMSQTSDYAGCSFVDYHDNIIVNPRGESAITVDDGDRFDIHHNTIYYSSEVTAAKSYVIRFNTVTNSTITDNKIYGNSNTSTGLSMNTSDKILIRNNIITGVTSKYQNVSDSSTNVILEQDGATLGQYASYAGPSNALVTSAPSVTVKAANSIVNTNDYIGSFGFYSADTSGPGAGVRASIGVKAIDSNATVHQMDVFLDNQTVPVTTIKNTGDAIFTGRVSGSNATAATEFVTLQQTYRTLKDFYTDEGSITSASKDLCSYTVSANRLQNVGDKIIAEYEGTFGSSSASNNRILLYFSGSTYQLFDSGTFTRSAAGSWNLKTTLMRVSSTTIRVATVFIADSVSAALNTTTYYTNPGSINFATSNTLKMRVPATTNNDDIVAKMGVVYFCPAQI